MEELKVRIPLMERVAPWDVSEHVDLLQWFKENRKDIPLISRAVHAAFHPQSRMLTRRECSSHAKRVNDPLRRSMGGDVFEMNVLALANQDQLPELLISFRMRPKGCDVDPELEAKLLNQFIGNGAAFVDEETSDFMDDMGAEDGTNRQPHEPARSKQKSS